MGYFLETLKPSTIKIISEFEASKQVWHNASVGMLREKIVKNILLPYLPDCYGISSGLCVDSKETKSKQLDIIIYDKIYSYRLPFDDDFIVFPCESVYGNIEVKTNLNSHTLKESVENVLSLKKLQREAATEFDLTPRCELRIGEKKLGTTKNSYFGVVFAFESSSVQTIIENLSQLKYDNSSLLPDLIILLDKETVIFKANLTTDNGLILNLSGNADGYIPISTGKDTIAYFILYLLTVLYHNNLKAMNPSKIFYNDIMKDKGKSLDMNLFAKI